MYTFNRQQPMRLISYILCIFIISWSSYWWIVSQQMENSITNWFNQKHPKQDLSFDKITTSGYPNRVDISVKNFSYFNFNSQLSISVELIQLLSLIYNKSHLINIIIPPIEINLKKSYLQILGPAIKSSLKINSDNELIEFVSEGENLQFIDTENNIWNLNKFLFATEKLTQKNPETFRNHLSIRDLDVPTNYFSLHTKPSELSNKIKKITINSEMQLLGNFRDFLGFNEKLKVTDLNLNMVWDQIDLRVTGNFEITDKTALTGSFKFKLNDWRSILSIIERTSILNNRSYKRINAALTFLASQTSSNLKDLTFHIKLEENVLFFGPLKIGKIKSDH